MTPFSRRTTTTTAAACLAILVLAGPVARAQEQELLAGLDIEALTVAVEQCNGDFGDIVSLYMVEATPLIEVVHREMGEAKREAAEAIAAAANSTAATNATETAADVIEVKAQSKGDAAKPSGIKGAVLDIMSSPEWDVLLQSETLQRISDEMELDCVMKDENFVEVFETMVAGQNISDDHPLSSVISSAPAIVSGFYGCGGRIVPVLNFADGVVPDLLTAEVIDPMGILSSPHFMDLVGSGFDMACFFGVPEVGALIPMVMG